MVYEDCSFEEDEKFSKNPEFQKCYDAFYKSEYFRKNYLAKMWKRNIPIVIDVIRTEIPLVQKKLGVDAIIVLNNNNRLPVDEKTDKPTYNTSPNIFLELVSNPSSEYKTDGWAYHRGVFICYSSSNDNQTGLVERMPVFFFIDEDFINAFNRNKKYPSKQINKKTNGLYASIGKKIPREDIFAFNGVISGQQKLEF